MTQVTRHTARWYTKRRWHTTVVYWGTMVVGQVVHRLEYYRLVLRGNRRLIVHTTDGARCRRGDWQILWRSSPHRHDWPVHALYSSNLYPHTVEHSHYVYSDQPRWSYYRNNPITANDVAHTVYSLLSKSHMDMYHSIIQSNTPRLTPQNVHI